MQAKHPTHYIIALAPKKNIYIEAVNINYSQKEKSGMGDEDSVTYLRLVWDSGIDLYSWSLYWLAYLAEQNIEFYTIFFLILFIPIVWTVNKSWESQIL